MTYSISPALLRALYRRLDLDAHNVNVHSASENWMSDLATLLHTKGLNTRMWLTSLPTIAPQITDGLPALGVTPSGEWILLENHSWNWVYCYNLSHDRAGWKSIRSLDNYVEGANIPWLLIEPIQPKSILSSEKYPLHPLQRLSRLMLLEKLDLGMVIGLGILIGVCALATPLTIQILINWVAFGGLTQPIISLGLILFAILCIHAGLSLFQRIIVERFERRLFVRTVEDLSRRFHQVCIETLDNINVSDLANRFFDILTVQKATSTLMIEGMGSVLQILVATGVLALYHPWFLVVDGLLVLGMVGVFWLHAKRGTKTAIVESKSKYKVASWIESIGSHSAAFRIGDSQIAGLESERLTSIWLEHRERHFNVFIQQYGSAQIFQIFMSILLLLLGGQLVLDGELSIGQFVAAEFVVTNALMGFTKFIDKMDTIYDLLASLDKLGSVLDLNVEPVAGRPKPASKDSKPIEVLVDDLSVPTVQGRLSCVFESNHIHFLEISPTVPLRQFAELLCGIRTPTSGLVMHDGVEVQNIGIADRYTGVCLLSSSQLFDGSIFDNIAMGNPRIGEQEIWHSLEQLGIKSFFQEQGITLNSPMIHDAPLLLKGILLSRCLLGNHTLVVFYRFFDELPLEWRQRWLTILNRESLTCIVLETSDQTYWYSQAPFLSIGLCGGLHDYIRP